MKSQPLPENFPEGVVFGAVDPKDGESFILLMPQCNTACMNVFLRELSKMFPDECIILVADGAGWHKAKGLVGPCNIEIVHLSPYAPEMNPIEQIWKAIRACGFRNEICQNLKKVVDRLCEVIRAPSPQTTRSITGRSQCIATSKQMDISLRIGNKGEEQLRAMLMPTPYPGAPGHLRQERRTIA